jgi:hypothetical protein
MIEFILDALTLLWNIFHWTMFVVGCLVFVILLLDVFIFGVKEGEDEVEFIEKRRVNESSDDNYPGIY